MNVVLRPKRWFEKMDPLVDQWREHFYPEIDDWSGYDSPVTAARPDAFEAIVEIFGVAPRLAKWIERNPELLDTCRIGNSPIWTCRRDSDRTRNPKRSHGAGLRGSIGRLKWAFRKCAT